ncbi:MAG: hypothetical protein IT210_11985 [Armatimonadetes bacterium]|nr:hypothetical protein [Armatimonadota bacterium]
MPYSSAGRIITALALFFCLPGACGEADSGRLSLQARARESLGRREGCVAMLEVKTGRLLAAWPPQKAARAEAAPGSVFKLVTACAALEEGVTRLARRIECRNVFPLERRSLWCSRSGGHGLMNIREALAHSCNIHFYALGLRLGRDRLLKWSRLFGLGRTTGYSPPGESPGSLPDRAFHPVDVARLAIGQGASFRVTPLQMARLAALVASEGRFLSLPGAGKARQLMRRPVHSVSTWRVLKSGMRLAVERGTAKKAAVAGLAVAGKTGSPERAGSPDERDGWFVGFAPADKPAVAIAVYIARGHGGDNAAPVARKMLEAWKGMR